MHHSLLGFQSSGRSRGVLWLTDSADAPWSRRRCGDAERAEFWVSVLTAENRDSAKHYLVRDLTQNLGSCTSLLVLFLFALQGKIGISPLEWSEIRPIRCAIRSEVDLQVPHAFSRVIKLNLYLI